MATLRCNKQHPGVSAGGQLVHHQFGPKCESCDKVPPLSSVTAIRPQNIAHFIFLSVLLCSDTFLKVEASSAEAQTIISGMQPANLELYNICHSKRNEVPHKLPGVPDSSRTNRRLRSVWLRPALNGMLKCQFCITASPLASLKFGGPPPRGQLGQEQNALAASAGPHPW